MPSATTSANYDEDFLSERILNFTHNNDFLLNGSNFPGLNNTNHGYPSGSQKAYPSEKDFDTVSDCVSRNSPLHASYNGPSNFFTNKISNGMISSAFTTPNPGNKIMEEFHSLQNSPFYEKLQHYTNSNLCMQSNGGEPLYMSRRPPQRELFPTTTSNGWATGLPVPSGGLYPIDRLQYINYARSKGFIVGQELEHIKENSRRSTSHTYGRISVYFRNRYGETEAKTKASYLQLGVRVPTKDHVSEIVGKGGQKIKLIREETGALITTPGENEDHVFIIEAPPEIALKVAELIANRALEITQSKANASERRRGSTNSIPGCASLFNGNGITSATTINGGQRLISRSPDDLPNATIPSPSPLLKSPLTNGGNYSNENGFFSSNGNGLSNGGSNNSGTTRTLLARSKISVPQDMVGKIIGTQGSIITTIQKDTGTEIKSPPKEAARGPSATSEFEISAYQSQGMTVQDAEARVQQAKQLIGHLVMRQFERRYSEELDDNNTGNGSSAKSRNNSNGEDFDGNSGGKTTTNNTTSGVAWMWPDVQQMDAKEAQDVLDRILAESKSKTRRVKELQAAAASTTGSLPASPCGLVSGGNNSFAIEFFPTADKSAGSCQNSPFHQSRIPSHNNVFSANAATAPGSMNLFERRLTNVDFHSESEFPDNQHAGMCPNPLFWSNPGPRHSFSAGAPNVGDSTSPTLLRRHTMASAEPYKPNLHNTNNTNEASALDKHSEVELNVIQALENLGLGGDEVRNSCQDHPPGFTSHFPHVRHQSSSSTWPVPSFFPNSEQQEDLTARNSNIWSNAASVLSDHLSTAAATTHSVIPTAAASISSSSSGSVNRCGIIGEERRRPSPSNSTSTAPPESS
ncbi:unnamed protein product [Hymenolepis diminuta]|uniref:KH domain-containing protein n=1 Tax=Hymenolepis diminuta TaxID=6216 RepID=A0A0R3SVM1_HYMDI|nr:unnamed protein product [Hymenolepis diminuta]VUZ44674.1 unnamed protein product [Hymenolepis diminuta]